MVKFNSRRGDIWTRAGKTAEVVLACVYPVGGRDAGAGAGAAGAAPGIAGAGPGAIVVLYSRE